jgi:hypothetical protein
MDAYQQRANECLELAKTSRDIGERTTLRELALCWLRLSAHAERFRAQLTANEGHPAVGLEIRR